jgi:hypothetical protein
MLNIFNHFVLYSLNFIIPGTVLALFGQFYNF